MLHIVITFDYELYFGKNYGSSSNVLFEPAERIVDILNAEGVKATFYADVCSAIQHEKFGLSEYARDFSAQLHQFYRQGHDVALHIHPHWMTSTYADGEWAFDNRHYSLNQCGYDEPGENSAMAIVEQACDYLDSMMKTEFPAYRCLSYRAGGYSLEPHTKLFPYLRNRGISIDSSVAMFTKSLPNAAQQYDYTELPDKLNWFIDPALPVCKDANGNTVPGAMYELPIAYYKKSLTDRILLGKSKMSFKRGAPRGTGIAAKTAVKEKQSCVSRLLHYGDTYLRLTLDTTGADFMITALNRMYRKYHADQNDYYVAVIGHPKSFTGEAFDNMKRFVNGIKQRSDHFCFSSTKELYQHVDGLMKGSFPK